MAYASGDVALAKYGRYEAIHLIASGGMASVYLGRTRGAGGFERLVALKVMHEHISHDPTFGAMFLDEARLAARIRHPNVVPTLDVADDGRYIVMEYVEGASLHAILTRLRKTGGGRLPLPTALRIFVDALTGLHAAHELCGTRGEPLNIVHRDVSPHNILVGVDGTSRITDFGIAFAEARITSTRGGQLKGKLPYMAPEQLEDEAVDRRADVYAAGCVLWEMLTGVRLFRGSNEAAIACAVLAGPSQSPREVVGDIPEALDAACMMALRRRDERFMTALALADAVEAAAEAEGIRLAKHRKVGAFAQEGQTYPAPASIISSGGAKAALEAEPATVRADTSPDADEDDAAPDPTSRGATLVSLDESAPLPPHARTTAEDRPPPEVAEVIRAAYRELEKERGAPPSSDAPPPTERSLDDTAAASASVVTSVPLERVRGAWIGLLVVAFAIGGVAAWFMNAEPPDGDVAARSASAATETGAAAAPPAPATPPTAAAPTASSQSAAPAEATAEATVSASKGPAPIAAPPKALPPVVPAPQPPAQLPAQPKGKPSTSQPPPSGTGYHPSAP